MLKVLLSLLFFATSVANGQKIEKIGGMFALTKIEKIKNGGYKVFFKPEFKTDIEGVILESDHIHAGIKEGAKLKMSAEIRKVEKKIAYADQIVLFIPSAEGTNPVWLVSRGRTLKVEKDLLKQHAPSTDFIVL